MNVSILLKYFKEICRNVLKNFTEIFLEINLIILLSVKYYLSIMLKILIFDVSFSKILGIFAAFYSQTHRP